MRVRLFWNESAGEGVALDELRSTIEAAGHVLADVVTKSAQLHEHPHDVDLVAAAGGDGTIARVGRALAEGDIPMAVLPLGTANNVANSLGIDGELPALVAGWSTARRVRIDVGLIETGGTRMHFIESVGFGLVASGIHEAAGRIPKGDPEVHLEEARQFYIDLLDRSDATPYTIALDGDTISGNYVLIEALNAPMIGPRINLTAHASIADGLLSIVAVANADRARLRAYFEALRGGSTADAGFTSWRAPRLEIGGASRMHIDDRVVDVDGPVRISIAPAALPVLV